MYHITPFPFKMFDQNPIYKMADVKVTPPNDFPLGLIRSHMVVIQLFLMLCDLQRVVRDLCPTLQCNTQDVTSAKMSR